MSSPRSRSRAEQIFRLGSFPEGIYNSGVIRWLTHIGLPISVALGPAIALAQSPAERDLPAAVAGLEQTLVDVIARVEPSVVAVARSKQPQAREADARIPLDVFGDLRPVAAGPHADTVAAGVIIDPIGLVLTEFLAVRQGDDHWVTLPNGQTYPAQIQAADPRSGLAILTLRSVRPPQQSGDRSDNPTPALPTSFPAVRLGDADELHKGQFVIAIGNPFAIRSDGQPTASWGIVTNLARKAPPGTNFNDAPGPGQDYRTTLHHLGTLIQTDAKLGWSAGGGALVNLRGDLVGLTTTAAEIAGHEQPAGYAIPINRAFRRIIDALKDGREVEYGLLGLSLRPNVPVGTGAAARHVLVQYAYPGSPADRAGLKPGDVILRVADKPISDVDELQLQISLLPPSSSTTIDYTRGGVPGSTRVSLAKLGTPGNKVVSNPRPAWRGIRVDYATALDALVLGTAIESGALDPDGCVLVAAVEPGSEAEQAGIQPGMFISHVGEQRVTTPADFQKAVKNADSVRELRLTKPTPTK